jgi:hypothetical protein
MGNEVQTIDRRASCQEEQEHMVQPGVGHQNAKVRVSNAH